MIEKKDGAIIIMEDGDNLLTENATEITNSQFTSIASAIIEYLQTVLSTNGFPAEFFSLLSVKNVTAVVNDPNLHLELGGNEDGGVILNEDGTNLLAEEPRTTVVTSEPHYFHENDEIYLDNFTGSVMLIDSTNGTDNAGDKLLNEDGDAILNETSNTDTINGKLFSVQDVDIENSSILLEDDNFMLLETDGDNHILNEDVAKITLKDPVSLTDYGSLEFGTDDVDTTGLSISTFGKIYRPSKTASSGLPINLLSNEYIGEYTDYVVDHYLFHHHTEDLSSISGDDTLIFQERRVAVESNVLLEDGDDLLLEDGVPTTSGTYSGTTSGLGIVLIDAGIVLQDSGGYADIMLTEAQSKVVSGSYLKDETIYGEDNIILEDGNRIELEDSGLRKGVLYFDQPFDYKAQPHENNNGFGYFKHRVDQRVSV